MTDLSIVIIARNEERTIGGAIEATLIAAGVAVRENVIRNAQVIFVDSASTDRTVEIASRYPIEVVRLPMVWPLSAAAGIYTGFRRSTGRYFAVIDGDVIVSPGWFREGILFLESLERAACVYGWWEEGSEGSGMLFESVRDELHSARVACAQEREFTGNGIFRSDALKEVGGHNPFLRGAEDKDISFRLRERGWKVYQIPVQIGTHDWHLSWIEYFRSIANWSLGDGHAAAYALRDGNVDRFDKFARQYDRAVVYRVVREATLILAAFGGALGLGITGSIAAALVCFIASGLLLLVILRGKQYHNGGWRIYIYHFIARVPYVICRAFYFQRGLKQATPPVESYPRE